ncbi:MAG: raffinose synthase [Acidobacteria bacterium]|nr:raffinose synthase [Acidobacteriota bacterium]MBI3280665.1 raffinose synthase [Acidobacteriota bacterium]
MTNALSSATLVLCLTAGIAAGQDATKLSFRGNSGVEMLREASAAPDGSGVIRRYALDLPRFEAGTYWRASDGPDWYNGTNRMRVTAFRRTAGLREGGFFLLLKLRAGGYLAVLPLTGNATTAWLVPAAERFDLSLGNLGTARVNGPFPVAAWARAGDPYSACREVWRKAMATEPISVHLRPRGEKKLPEFLHYLGFATWEEYRENYDAGKLVDMMRRIHASGVPIRWIQIGMGHHDIKRLGRRRLLNSLDPDAQKFPQGWRPVMAARKEDGIKWLGVFQALSGYPQGIHPQNALGALNDLLMPVPSGAVQPRNDPRASAAFYDTMLASVKRHGFAFIKMDFETPNLQLYMGTPNPVEAAVNNQRSYQAAAAKYLDGTINCMAHNGPDIFNTAGSAMTRVSQDYHKGDAANARLILYHTYGNLPWAGQTVWGDHDMFHSSDTVSAKLMAVAKAVSGGTVYLSDGVDRFNKDLIAPLCYQDGRILRPLAPAAPLPESLFVDPAKDAYRVVAPLPDGAAALLIYNLTRPVQTVRATVGPDDYRAASIMMQPYPGSWEPPQEGLVMYDWRERSAAPLKGGREVQLGGFEDRFLLLCPVQEGWSVIGRTDKYLSPAAVKVISRTRDALVLEMAESGPLSLWSAAGNPVSKQAQFRPAGGGLWTADIPTGKQNFTVRIERRRAQATARPAAALEVEMPGAEAAGTTRRD